MHHILLWCHTDGEVCNNKTYMIESAPHTNLCRDLPDQRLREIIDYISDNAWIFEERNCNDVQFKQLEAAVNKRNKLNRLNSLKDDVWYKNMAQ